MSKLLLSTALIVASLSTQALAQGGQPNALELSVDDEITSAHLYMGGTQPMRYGNESIKGIAILLDKYDVEEGSELKSSVLSFGYGTYGYSAYFGPFRTVISGLSEHPFRFNPNAHSAIIRTLLS